MSDRRRQPWWIWVPWPPVAVIVVIVAMLLTFDVISTHGSVTRRRESLQMVNFLVAMLVIGAGAAMSMVQAVRLAPTRVGVRRPGLCAHCGYQVAAAGTPAPEHCPECGLAAPDSHPVVPRTHIGAAIVTVIHLACAIVQFIFSLAGVTTVLTYCTSRS